ncbi:SNF2 family DNA-dependent ATPase [Xylariales sp. PMI_506]|nr:SNF2 family DNA-dependent ATPase [Xylariales sp. PMI_506]
MASNDHSSGYSGRNGFPDAPLTNARSAPLPSFDPALLLNPRAHVGASRGNIATNQLTLNGLPGSSSSSSLDFQFSSPNDGTASNASTPPAFLSYSNDSVNRSYTSTPVSGFGSMIERMSNLQDRASVPQPKRRRLEGEEGNSPNRFGGGSNGALGQHVRDTRNEAAGVNATPLSRVDTVDLTETHDDSDVVEIQDLGEQEVCFGLLQGARISCDIVPSPKPGARALYDGYWPQVKLMLNRKHGDATNVILVKDHTRRIVGKVDPQTALGLSPLLDSPRLYLRTDCKLNSRLRKPGEQAGQPTSEVLFFDLILYGPRKSGRAVANHLANRGLRLRHPTRVDPGIKYENPMPQGTQPQALVKPQFIPTTTAYPPVARTVEEIRSEVMGVFDSLTRSEDLPEMEPDDRITSTLLRHQKQGLHFMTMKEQPRQLSAGGKTANSFWQMRLGKNGQKLFHNVITGQNQAQPPPETYGGILADMMGLGKTLSILSLITTTLDAAEAWSNTEPVAPRPEPPTKHNGQPRGFNVPTPEPLALTKPTRNSRATLLVCPLSTIANWEIQIKEHIKPGAFQYYIYHGPNRIKDIKKLAEYDLVITTYGSVSSEVRARHRGSKGPHPLEDISWFRVVLDEAHMIREQSTLLFKAICRLQANRRWAVTGTPVQNKLDDLAALLAFIRLKPFDNKSIFTQYIVAPFKVCDTEVVPKLRVLVDSITLRRLKDKINLPPRTDQIVRLRFSPNEDKIYRMFEQHAQDKVNVLSAGREKMLGGRTYIHILQSILRLRLISAHGKDLLSDEDLDLVQGMTEDSAIDIDSGDEEDVGKPAVTEARAYAAYELMQETNSDNCFVCNRSIGTIGNDDAEAESERDENTLGYLSSCFHLICSSCKPTWERAAAGRLSGTCPYCDTQIRFSLVELRKDRAEVEHDSHRNPANKAKTKTMNAGGYSGPHTKTRALVDDLLKSKAQTEANPQEPPFKSVVFSGWTSHLDLIQIALDEAGVVYTRLDGKMSRTARSGAMDRFREDDAVHVILVSITAGGLGLNLTAANNVYVMEPQYNPAAEAQAVDRVHRIGQKRPVRTVRYIMENSIEEKMLELQDKKTKLANLSMDRSKVMDKAEAARQKLMDLRSLFK